ncbi:glycosyltransferase [Chitinophaga sp. 30R24]|uniref:glycosyltransferase n=1 Tax=Chitinophaga sp. 30R24 TaxID=3248838 RepID=UPI003B8FBA88
MENDTSDILSVLMAVYIKDQPPFLHLALQSIVEQTVLPDEVVIVKDGKVTKEIEEVICSYTNRFPELFKIVVLENNVGLGAALREGLLHCSGKYVARMDADDISKPDRFERQLEFLNADPDCAVVGGLVQEFINEPGDIQQIRFVPLDASAIIKFARKRSPLNHPTVMFRKEAILAVGSYQDVPYFEDYYLWLRLISADFKIWNINDSLLFFRVGNDMIGRRHGWAYLKKELFFLKKVRAEGHISSGDFVTALFTRIPLRLLPKRQLSFIYKKMLRK